ncbi:MAG TPA: hypothetical protein VIW68_04175 [Candidatus Sulfotelmatobacter sp.]
MHSRELKKASGTDESIFGVAAWRDNPSSAHAERAAPALAEATTRISDRSDPVPEPDLGGSGAALRREGACSPDPRDR